MPTRYRLVIWWHRKRTGHHTYMRAVVRIDSAPFVLVTCDCGKRWRH